MKSMTVCGFFMVMFLVIGLLNPLWAVDEQRQAYDQMVEEATREADEYVQQKQQEQQAAAEQMEKAANATVDERVQVERDRLEAEMDKIRERSLGPNYTEGMRENQLQELETRLDQLDSDPQAYFGE